MKPTYLQYFKKNAWPFVLFLLGGMAYGAYVKAWLWFWLCLGLLVVIFFGTMVPYRKAYKK